MKDDVKQDGLGATALRNIAAEAGRARGEPRAYAAQASWTSPISNKLLAEVVTQWHAETPTDVSPDSPAFTTSMLYPSASINF